jgi:two-component system cell cycle response regulator DivK
LEAINLAYAGPPDLILMDIQLPDISGLEVTRRLRDDERSRRIPIIAVTAFAMGWHEREALDSGCDAYISKPIAILGLLRAVESFLSRFPLASTGFADLRSSVKISLAARSSLRLRPTPDVSVSVASFRCRPECGWN